VGAVVILLSRGGKLIMEKSVKSKDKRKRIKGQAMMCKTLYN